MEYNLPLPDVSGRMRFMGSQFHTGDVMAFRYNTRCEVRTGLIVMADRQMMLLAYNLYEENDFYYMEEIPEDIELFTPNREEKEWGQFAYFEYLYVYRLSSGNKHPIVEFIETECPTSIYKYESTKWDFCYETLSSLFSRNYYSEEPDFKKKVWKYVIEGINPGLAFNKYKAELYCFLLALILISEKTTDESTRNLYRNTLLQNWDQFSWMYAMFSGRIIGTDFNNFTQMVNQLDNTKRNGFIHLYIPLIELNKQKIYKYSNIEKPYKLEHAIEKIKQTGERIEQNHSLDDLFSILFPKVYQNLMNAIQPTASIKELKEELAKKDEQINHWKKTAEGLTEAINQLTEGMKLQVEKSLSMEDVSTAILAMPIEIASTVCFNLDFKLRKNKVWNKGRESLLDKLDEKMKAANGTSIGTNNGIVTGGNFNANLQFTNEQVEMLIKGLALNEDQKTKLLTLTTDGNNNTR